MLKLNPFTAILQIKIRIYTIIGIVAENLKSF